MDDKNKFKRYLDAFYAECGKHDRCTPDCKFYGEDPDDYEDLLCVIYERYLLSKLEEKDDE